MAGTKRQELFRKVLEQGRRGVVGEARLELVRRGLCRREAGRGDDVRSLSRELARFNEDLVRAVWEIYSRKHPWLKSCTWLEFGSGGREEQVLSSDQDNGLIYPVMPDRHELDEVTQDVVMTLDGAGIPLCPGHVMMNADPWRGTFHDWAGRFKTWLAHPREKGPWQYGLFLDFRPLAGMEEPAVLLRKEVWEYVRTRPLVLRLLAEELNRYRIPLTFWGTFVLIRKGPFQGGLDIKTSAQIQLTTAARILALKYGITEHHTLDRVQQLGKQGHLGGKLQQRLMRFWLWSQEKRLEIGLRERTAGRMPHNVIFPYQMKHEEMLLLKDGLQGVETLSKLVLAGAGL